MNEVNDNLDNAIFGRSMPTSKQKEIQQLNTPFLSSVTGNADSDKDYREVRDNIKRIITQSETAIQGILQVAEETQSARAYEVASQLISATLEANNKLMHLHKQLKDIKREELLKSSGNVTTTNNNIFVGNTAELSKFLKARKELESATNQLPHADGNIIDAC